MPLQYKLGKRHAVADARVARMSVAASTLPDPPPSSNWYADIAEWQMLGNDSVGDCVVAFAMHYIYQQMCYLAPGHAPVPTAAEAVQNYAAIGGYDPAKPDSDQGLSVMGAGGLIEYWTRTGLVCGGTVHKLTNAVQITRPTARKIRQAINLFGGVGIGIRLPQWIMDAPDLPFVWDTPGGDIAGYHEMYLCGYETIGGFTYYDCITWGQRVRLTEQFLLAVFDEAVCPLSTDGFDAGGANAAGISRDSLSLMMISLRDDS